jgi:nitroreductase
MSERPNAESDLTAGEQIIRQRRSIRKYTDEPVAPELVERLLMAGMAAPSASNKRPWEFVVVDDPDLLGKLQLRLIFGRHRPPLVIIVCGHMGRTYPAPARDFWVQDCSAAAQNILLAATALGLGSVWIGIHPVRLLSRAVAGLLKLPKEVMPLGALYVGHPAETKEPRTQYDPARVHRNGY